MPLARIFVFKKDAALWDYKVPRFHDRFVSTEFIVAVGSAGLLAIFRYWTYEV